MSSPTGPKVEQENFLEKLIKIMGLTASSNDGEALAALRMGTALLLKNKHTWETILRGKVKVVESPFTAGQHPKPPETTARTPPTPPPSARPVHAGRARKVNPTSFGGSSSTVDPPSFGQAYNNPPQATSWTQPKPTPKYTGNCKRCNGTGIYSWAPGKEGACFNCQGTGTFTGKTAPKSHARGQADLDSL